MRSFPISEISCSYSFFKPHGIHEKIILKYQNHMGPNKNPSISWLSDLPVFPNLDNESWGKQNGATYTSTCTYAETVRSLTYWKLVWVSQKKQIIPNVVNISTTWNNIAILLLGKHLLLLLLSNILFTKWTSHHHQHPMPNLPPQRSNDFTSAMTSTLRVSLALAISEVRLVKHPWGFFRAESPPNHYHDIIMTYWLVHWDVYFNGFI